MSETTILIIDDEKEIRDLIEIYMVSEGWKVIQRGDASTLESDLEHCDLVILDLMLPGMSGLDALRVIRENSNKPVIVLSAKSQDADKIIGLNLGADDYMTKPFNPLELVARVKSQLRRYQTLNPATADGAIRIGELEIDEKRHIVKKNGIEIALTPTEFSILFLLASHPNIVFSIEEIFETVWKERYYDANNTVMVHIRKLREKIENNPRYPEYVQTVWGVGYKVCDPCAR